MALTKRIFRFFDKTKRRNKVTCVNEENKKKMKKKLHLVLDLDHTLLHTIHVSQLSHKEKDIINKVGLKQDLRRVKVGNHEFFIKLRPYLPEFLQEANEFCHMYVYTMGTRSYAQAVLQLIDPDKVYFGDRFKAREDSPNMKRLKLLRLDKRKVVIVDDSKDIWPKDKKNLVEISQYFYFRDKSKSKSYAEKKRDESESKGALANVLKLLKKAHKRFEDELDSNDLRELINEPCVQCCF